ncbi:MAG TPA: hypothetical protein VK700_07605 [Steroidobacteraceae bacterium]|jgi:hypothetical protein|nr:hypothetical protein [Steroidobacteraceae bacterium]
MKCVRPGKLLAALAMLCLSGRSVADEAPPPAPSVPAIKACIKQMDLKDQWTFSWKLVEIGAPRHPRNSYEALYAPAGPGRDSVYGYPVHVMYNVNALKDIDAVYWLIRDSRGHWQIPAICTIQ